MQVPKKETFCVDAPSILMDKMQAELLLSMFDEYENFARDTDLIVDALRKNLDGGYTLNQVQIEVMYGHVTELVKMLQGIGGFIEPLVKK